MRTITFDNPEDLSPLVADLYRWWYQQRRIIANRLFVSSFFLMEPFWTLRTASTPFWMKFNTETSAENLERYINNSPAFDEIYMTLFSHGTESAGLASIDRWRELLGHARKTSRFVGVDESKYPKDFGVFARYHEAIQEIPARYPLPGRMAIEQLDAFLKEKGDRYKVNWDQIGVPA